MRPSVLPAPSSLLPVTTQPSSLASTVRNLPPGARPSAMWRDAAFVLLRLNPKEAETLALEFEEENASDETRMLVLDLLAGAGTFEAQVVIRRLLALAVARRSNRTFALFVQRLGILECPDGPTLRFLMSVYAESRCEPHDVRASCAYALGAAAGQALAAGDADAAVRASDVLRRDLLSAGTVIEKCALLTALGNAGIASDVMVVTRFTQDADAPVRSAAALAFRKLNVPEARAHLMALLGDPEPKVAQSALVALSEHKLEEQELEVLAEMVLGGRIAMSLDGRVLRLVVAQRPRLMPSSGRSGAIESAVRLLLGRVEAGVGASELPGSGERRAVRESIAMPVAPVAVAPVVIAHAEQPTLPAPRASVKTQLQVQAHAQPSIPANAAATILDQPPMGMIPAPSGSFRIVNPGDTVEQVRARMLQLGLDPNARMSIIPQPPPRRESPSSMPPMMAATPAPVSSSRQPTQLQANAIVRR